MTEKQDNPFAMSDEIASDKNDSENALFNRLVTLLKQSESFDNDSTIDRLKDALNMFRNPETFNVGDIVVWRQGMKNKTYPEYGEPAIVVEVFDPPFEDDMSGIGSAYFKEQISLRLGVILKTDGFVTFVYDGRRFEHYENPRDRLEKLADRITGENPKTA